MKELPTTYRGIVYPWHCDHIGHMNVMWYVGKFDEATWGLAALFGVTNTYMKRENRGMVAAEQRILYKRELLSGTVVSVRTGIIEVSEKKVKFFHEMINEETGEVAAITFLTGIHIDTILRKACPLPEEFRKLAEGYVTDNIPQG
jgi:acyl-CoA thioester hydrolase